MTLAQLSDLAMTTSVVLYLVAMVVHALEWASARRTVSSEEAVSSGASATASASGGVTVLERTDVDATSVRVDLAGRIGLAFTVIAFGTHLLGVITRGLAADRFPWGNMYEFVTSAMVFVVAAYLVAAWKFGMRWLGLGVTLLAAIANGLAVTVFYVQVGPLVPALHSVWFVVHIIAACIAAAAFNLGGLAAILYLVRARAEKRGDVTGYLARIPSSEKLDVASYRLNAFAFPVWTFTIAAGAIWAEYAWGRYWGWDPKETWSLVTWVVYAAYLHARATAGWKGAKAAWLAILGLALFWFNFIGVNLLVSGLHSYAGI